MSVAALLITAGFSKGETRAALRAFEHGKLPEEEAVGRGDRYVDQIWRNTRAAPRNDPRDDPGYLEDQDQRAAAEASRAPGRKHAAPPPLTSWPEPVDCFIDLGGAAAIATVDEVPPPLWRFVADTAERMGVATSSVALSAITTCSSVIDEQWHIQPKRYDWEWLETAILWALLVGPPSTGKTPIIRACTRPLERLEWDAQKAHAKALAAWKVEHRKWEDAKKEAKKTRTKGDPDVDNGRDDEPQRPRRDRYIVESFTMESLQDVLRDDEQAKFSCPAGKVLCRQQEMSGLLANLDRYSSSGRSGGDQADLLKLADGGPYSVDRVGRGSFFSPSWAACVLGGIQPEPIQAIASRAADDGLLQRFMYDVPQPGLMDGEDRHPTRAVVDAYRALFPALIALHPAKDADERAQPVILHADGHQYRERLNDVTGLMSLMPDTSARLRSALGKWPGLFARLCLTFHMIEVADAHVRGERGPPLSVASAATAARVERYMRRILLPHLLRADAVMFSTTQTSHARWIAGYILAHGLDRITVRDVVRAYSALRAPEKRKDLDTTMASLVAIAWLDPEASSNDLVPVSAWRVNPMVHQHFAARAAQEKEARLQRREDVLRKLSELGEDA
jgi:hypothetical protein